MEWGDAILWKAVKATPGALEDADVKERLFHIHFTQYAFHQAWIGEKFERLKSEDFDSLSDVEKWMRGNYPAMLSFLNSIDDTQLNAPMPLPWAVYFGRQLGREVEMTTLGETMLQVSNHSIHHRAQVNMQVGKHGGKPPLIDYIAWLWSGRPAADWD